MAPAKLNNCEEAEISERTLMEKGLRESNASLTAELADLQKAFQALKQEHEKLRRTQLELLEAAKMEALGRMAASVAHEIKNPLMTLSLAADYFLNRKAGTPQELLLLQDMKEAVQRANKTMDVLLDCSRSHPLQHTEPDLTALQVDLNGKGEHEDAPHSGRG